MSLTTKKKQELKARAHRLKPIVFIGNKGLTDAVNKEIDRGLNDHELIKLRIAHEDRVLRREMFEEIAQIHKATLIQVVGCIGILYKKNDML